MLIGAIVPNAFRKDSTRKGSHDLLTLTDFMDGNHHQREDQIIVLLDESFKQSWSLEVSQRDGNRTSDETHLQNTTPITPENKFVQTFRAEKQS